MKYKIVLQKTKEGYSVRCLGLPGCWSQGDTELEAVENIRDAIQEYLAAVDESIKEADVREMAAPQIRLTNKNPQPKALTDI
jgi:predicted RNase H-like HicB family nuclease